MAVTQEAAPYRAMSGFRLGAGAVAYSQEIFALTRRWFIHIQRERLNLFFSVAQPALWLIFFGGMFRRTVDRSVIEAPDYTTFMLPGIIQTGKKQGMRLMDDALIDLYNRGLISKEEAYARADQKQMMRQHLKI